jgi:hypothetical protein
MTATDAPATSSNGFRVELEVGAAVATGGGVGAAADGAGAGVSDLAERLPVGLGVALVW